MNPTPLEAAGTACFGLAVLHTFSVKAFQHLAYKLPKGSPPHRLLRLLGEVEIVFALWAGLLVLIAMALEGSEAAVALVEKRNFTEPLLVFTIMVIAATRPVVALAATIVTAVARLLPLPRSSRFYFAALLVGPLLGSFITEPAAMTVTALLLRNRFFGAGVSSRFKYLTIGTLFVNVSIGGVLTHFAAPPVLMVARTWEWGTVFMLAHFGWKAAIACTVNAALATAFGLKDLRKAQSAFESGGERSPAWLMAVLAGLLGLVVLTAHHPAIFFGIFLVFLGLTEIARDYLDELKLKESLLVACFLAGLVVLGGLQTWWLKPLISGLDTLPLYLGAAALTAVTDNAALTYLGSQIPGIADSLKYALVAGAVAGGGLTVIANAPNPAGFAILRERFGPEGISPARLFLGALLPTFVALLAFGLGLG